MSEEEREYLNEMIRSLNNQLVDALRERDEARRMVCEWHRGLRVQHPQDYAKRRGWNCYDKEERNAALDRIAEFDQENGLL